MKNLCIVTRESVLGGGTKTGVGELCDSLGISFSHQYNVTLVTVDGSGSFADFVPETETLVPGIRKSRMFSVNYYLVDLTSWAGLVPLAVRDAEPDILHNFAEPELIGWLGNRPARAVYTIDNADLITQPELMTLYDAVTTVSENYAAEIMASGSALSHVLTRVPFRGVTNGILTDLLDPEQGNLITERFSADYLTGKANCKAAICEAYGLDPDKWLAVMLCRMVREKGLDAVIAAAPTIRATGGQALLVGNAFGELADSLQELADAGTLVWVRQFPHPSQCLQILAAGDFYLSPSLVEPCGLMQMTACRYGCVPITTLVGGLKDNMNAEHAVLIPSGGLTAAIPEAAALYESPAAFRAKRRAAMLCDFSWETRKAPYAELYEGGQ